MSTSTALGWTLREIARLERGGERPPRLTEPDHERWHRVRRKLGWVAFIELLHDDLGEGLPTIERAGYRRDGERWIDPARIEPPGEIVVPKVYACPASWRTGCV